MRYSDASVAGTGLPPVEALPATFPVFCIEAVVLERLSSMFGMYAWVVYRCENEK